MTISIRGFVLSWQTSGHSVLAVNWEGDGDPGLWPSAMELSQIIGEKMVLDETREGDWMTKHYRKATNRGRNPGATP